MGKIDFNLLNFAFYNGLGIAAAIVVMLYGFFIYDKFKKRTFDWSLEFAIGVFIATTSTVIERIYYGSLRALDLMEKSSSGEILSPSPIISLIGIIGMVGLLWHIKSMTKFRFKNSIFVGSLWVTFGVICASVFWGLAF